jgi:hypothetical protein
VSIAGDVKDDIGLEVEIGVALASAGLTRDASVFARSNLGIVTLDGAAPSARAAEDIARAVARMPGVREVRTNIHAPVATR